MKRKKIFIVIPDGISLRNFAYTAFVEVGRSQGWEIIFWNSSPFDLKILGYDEIKLRGKPRPWTDLLKRAKINVELDLFEERFQDHVFQYYKFPASGSNLKSRLKKHIVSFLTRLYKGEKGLRQLRKKILQSERGSDYYNECRRVLELEKPNLVFCASQRPVTAISPIEAARNLNIPTVTFIFSWDNLSKATLIVEADYYLVWSEHMKKDLKKYYPDIDDSQILITGTPQFEPHFKPDLLLSKDSFFELTRLDKQREYILYSGDDITTSPDDPKYLEDVARAIESLNSKGQRLGIIFRRCPVDFSDRYKAVLEKFPGIITELAPKWERIGGEWNTVLPLREDMALLANTIRHSIGVVNLGSTMVFDAVSHSKPCFYIRYDAENKTEPNWSVQKIYRYVHFRSMTSQEAVIWLNTPLEIEEKILKALMGDSSHTVNEAERWFKEIQFFPPQESSQRIWRRFSEITTECT